jgi:hypothetical protein
MKNSETPSSSQQSSNKLQMDSNELMKVVEAVSNSKGEWI